MVADGAECHLLFRTRCQRRRTDVSAAQLGDRSKSASRSEADRFRRYQVPSRHGHRGNALCSFEYRPLLGTHDHQSDTEPLIGYPKCPSETGEPARATWQAGTTASWIDGSEAVDPDDEYRPDG